jgi:hypothetical protein
MGPGFKDMGSIVLGFFDVGTPFGWSGRLTDMTAGGARTHMANPASHQCDDGRAVRGYGVLRNCVSQGDVFFFCS